MAIIAGPADAGQQLAFRDSIDRCLNVRLDARDADHAQTVWTAHAALTRVALLPTGPNPVIVWSDSSFGVVGAGSDKAEALRGAVQELVRQFADAWRAANTGDVRRPSAGRETK